MDERGLARSSPPYHPNLHPWLNMQLEILEDRSDVCSVAESGVFEAKSSLERPSRRERRVRGKHGCLLLLKLSILLHSLDAAHRRLDDSVEGDEELERACERQSAGDSEGSIGGKALVSRKVSEEESA